MEVLKTDFLGEALDFLGLLMALLGLSILFFENQDISEHTRILDLIP